MTELPAFSAIPVPETQAGIAIEAERGVPVAPAFWLPVMSPKYKPDRQYMPDEGLRGSMVTLYDEIPGLRFDSYGYDMYPYLDTLPVELRALLGSKDTLTAKPAAPTTLSKEGVAGESEVEVTSAAEITEGKTYIVIGSPSTSSDTRLVTKVTGKKLKLAYPLSFTHANASPVEGLTTHEFSLLNNSVAKGNQPPSCTITDFDGETNWRQIAACQLDSLDLTGTGDSLPKVSASWMGNSSTTPSAPSASFSTVEAPPGWTAQMQVAGVPIPYIVSWEYNLKRGVKNIPAITGTENYYQHFASALAAGGKMTVLQNPESTLLKAFQEGLQESLDFVLTDTQNGFALNLHATKSKFITGEVDRSKEWVEVPLEFQLIPSSTDALAGGVSPIRATVANGHTAEY